MSSSKTSKRSTPTHKSSKAESLSKTHHRNQVGLKAATIQEGLSSILQNLDAHSHNYIYQSKLTQKSQAMKSYPSTGEETVSSKQKENDTNLDFLKNLTQNGISHNNKNHHVNRSYLGIKGNKTASNYKAMLRSNE